MWIPNAEIAAETSEGVREQAAPLYSRHPRYHEQNVFGRYDPRISLFWFRPLKPPPAHHGDQAVRSPEFAADTAASTACRFDRDSPFCSLELPNPG
jgi:hypothetical protein